MNDEFEVDGLVNDPRTDLAASIRARGLPQSVAQIATLGGVAVHPALDHRADVVEMSPDGPAWETIRASGRIDLVPLWTCGTVTIFSAADGSFLQWSAEADEPWASWLNFADAVRDLLTDLWEDEEEDEDRVAIARLLLPEGEVANALVPVER